MALQEKQLGQTKPAGTSPVSIYSPGAGVTAIIRNITVTNLTGLAVEFSIYHDDDGTTYDETTALFFTVRVEKNQTVQLTAYVAMNNPAGNLAVQSSTASALNFTVYGAEST